MWSGTGMSCISGSMSKPGRYHYFLMYKPYGVLCQFTPEIPGQTTLAEVYAFPKGVYPAGRLDQDSEGMLLLTDDPGLKTMLLDPANSMTKSYAVQVEGCPAEADLAPLTKGMTIRIKGKPVSLRPAFFRIPNHPLGITGEGPSGAFPQADTRHMGGNRAYRGKKPASAPDDGRPGISCTQAGSHRFGQLEND